VVVKEGDALLIPAGTVHSYVNLRVVRIKIEGERVGGRGLGLAGPQQPRNPRHAETIV